MVARSEAAGVMQLEPVALSTTGSSNGGVMTRERRDRLV